MPGQLSGARYTCKCLNIRINPPVAPSAPPDLIEDLDFTPVFVGDEGIIVEHTQVTVRTRTPGKPIPETSRFSRYTTVTCLLCDLLVYRVYQTYPADVDGKEGPLLPTEDWVERDVMKSLNGWIEVNKKCLMATAVDRALSSTSYSAIFSLLLPETLPPPTSVEPIFERPASQSSILPPTPPPPPKHFTNLRPVFLPPPFTPSHPVFAYLASLAATESQAIRDAAEDWVNEQLKAKISEVEQADAELRRNVESLWRKFLDGVNLVQQAQDQCISTTANSRPKERAPNGTESLLSPTPIRDFTPTAVPPAAFSPTSVPRVSALSASLATSSFHHPAASSSRVSPPSSGRSPYTPPTDSADLISNTSTLVPPQQRSPGGSNVLKYRRNLQETIDYATSYKYFVDLEKDMSRLRGRQAESERSPEKQTQENGASHATEPATGTNEPHTPPETRPTSDDKPADAKDPVTSSPRGREKTPSKGKRKVTFDVQPAVVTIQAEPSEDSEEAPDQRTEMIFEFEENEEEGDQQILNFSRPTLQTAEPSVPIVRPRRQKPSSTSLSSSFSGLRPASLPAPSNIRPPRSQHGSDFSVPSMMLPPPRSSAPSKDKVSSPDVTSSPTRAGMNIDRGHGQDSEAARSFETNSPGTWGSWKTESKAWQTFARRQGRHREANGKIPEEGENDDGTPTAGIVPMTHKPSARGDDAMFVGSLPIPIQFNKPPPALSLASYQPRTLGAAQTDTEDFHLPVSPGRKQTSSAAIRKAVYAERDLLRSMDPGSLDFTAEEEEDKEDDVPNVVDTQVPPPDSTDVGDRGRKRALKILQSQSEIPEAGMWRSLTS